MLSTMMYVAATAGLLLGAEPIQPLQQCTESYWPSLPEAKDALFAGPYLRAPKVDWVKETYKVRVRGKTRWRTYRKPEAYGWKDQAAAERLHMAVPDYVFGKAVPEFTTQLYCMVAAAMAEGHNVVINSVFRDDWRQSIATGHKARDTDSYHGGSRRGGIGRAADVSVLGTWEEMQSFWDWIDKNGPARFKIGRPYGKGDPPHVGPTDGAEYLAHHGNPVVRVASKHKHRMAHHKGRKHKKIRLAHR